MRNRQPAENPKLPSHAEIPLEFDPRPGGGACVSTCCFITHTGISNSVPGHVYARGEEGVLLLSPRTDET